MKQHFFSRVFLLVAFCGALMLMLNSCSKEDSIASKEVGKVTGTLVDGLGFPVAGVNVVISGMDGSTTSGSDGKFTVENVTIESHTVTFSKDGYKTCAATVSAEKFDATKVATLKVSLLDAPAKIVGTVLDAKNGNVPLAGVTVSVSASETSVTGADGKYEIKNLPVANYTVTFAKTDYTTISRTVSKTNFVNNSVTLDIKMGGAELLPGLIVEDLKLADKWYYNEYRGGRNADAYPHWDWSTDYMCTLDFKGAWDEQNEGTTLQIRNSATEQGNPADVTHFDSFVYGSKKITADNKIMTLRVRTHDADATAPAYFGVQVIDLSAATPTVVKIGGDKTYGSSDYTDFDFDLSAYVGKEIVIAVGIYRKQTGNYYKQLVLRAIRFADKKVTDWNWLPGTEVLPNWKLTQEMVRSTMPHIKKSFTGISPVSGNRDNYKDAYRAWRNVNFIVKEWSFVPLFKDPEVFPSEGYLMKTRGSTAIDTETPEAYMYAKFAVAAGNNKLTLKTRNFGSNYTFFKLTVIKEDGTVTHIAPSSNTAQEALAAANGCWKFKHGKGGAGDPDNYASFVYDLSAYNGNNVVVALGVYKGETNTDENKLVIYSINMN